jgi:hypothetical protein
VEYNCKTISYNRMNIGPKGIVRPLCDSCKTTDCSNPIEKKQASIFGVTRTTRLFVRGEEFYCVVECMGYQPDV